MCPRAGDAGRGFWVKARQSGLRLAPRSRYWTFGCSRQGDKGERAMRIQLVSAAALVAVVVVHASAGVTYTSQTRTVRAFATSGGAFPDEQIASAPDFGSWDAEVFALSHPEPPQMDSTGHATQHSALTDSGITFN